MQEFVEFTPQDVRGSDWRETRDNARTRSIDARREGKQLRLVLTGANGEAYQKNTLDRCLIDFSDEVVIRDPGQSEKCVKRRRPVNN